MMSDGGDLEAGFAKLHGEDFEYYMQSYSIVLGRSSKSSTVDVDLSDLGGGMNISRRHARIFYDFQRRRFALEVLGRNGCFVEGVPYLPGSDPVKLDSQDLLRIGDKEFYFLLPAKSIHGGPNGSSKEPSPATSQYHHHQRHHSAYKRRYENHGPGDGSSGSYGGSGSKELLLGKLEKKARSERERENDDRQLLKLEENDIVSSVAAILSDACSPGEWMPMEDLHQELVQQFGNVWHHNRVRKYLTSSPETQEKPWHGLLMLLEKYPEHFFINSVLEGRSMLEYVTLVSFIS